MRCWPCWRGPRTLSLLLLLVGSAPLRAVTATLVADAHVNSDRPDANSGAISNLAVGAGYTTLLQFDLGVLPAGTTAAQVSRATLRMYVNRADTPGVVQVQTLMAAWGEYSVTYTSRPALGTSAGQISVTQAGSYVTLDATALVQSWLAAPANNHGLGLTAPLAAVQFDSKENELTGHAPELDVVLATFGSAGPQGLTGPTGPAGPQGATGAQGPAGATGPAGPTGATGPQGPPGGLNYQGIFTAATTYGVGAVVSFGGSSWVSLVAGNRGNAPSLVSSAWGLLAQAQPGTAGATGPQGPAGPQGAAGAMGLQGPAGVAGPRGLPGLAYQGSYNLPTNYAAGDVVSWQGASYVSLAASNHANPPDTNAGWWGLLSAQGPSGVAGPQGPVGPQGLSGPAGSVGPAGERGPQGVQGIAGQTGAQGVAGPQGLQGVPGPVGPQGATGAAGMTFRGAYNAFTNYALADAVSYNGASYLSLQQGNSGNAPDRSPAQWAVLAAGGAAGPQGPAGVAGLAGAPGPQGVAGATGQTGPAGPTGPQGPAIANFVGPYSPQASYGVHDAVSYSGSTYVSAAANNTGNTPGGSTAQWVLLVAKGDTGSTGPAGVQGPAGPSGPQGATGAAGAAGPRGATGAIGIVYRGAWSAGTNYNPNDAVTFGGSTYLAQASSSAVPPDQSPAAWALLAASGVAGPTGPGGAAATVVIGSVSTGAPGSAAAVTNSGTSTAAVLNFTIPQGAAGTVGGSGGGGSNAAAPSAVYHSVSYNFNYWSVANSNASLTETDGTVLTWVPNGCTATRLQVFSMQGKAITVTLRGGAQGALTAVMSCQSPSGSSCSASGNVAVLPGSFMDLLVSGANGTAAPVWTAVSCE